MLKRRIIGGLCGLAVGGSAGAFSYAQTAMGASPVLGVPVALFLAVVGTVGGVIVGAWTAPKPEVPEARPLDRLRADPSWATEQRRYVREAIEQQLAHTIAMVAVHPAAARGDHQVRGPRRPDRGAFAFRARRPGV
jgi:Na+/glutamate symporter